MNLEIGLKTPVVFIIFKRPELTQKVFEAIRKVRPSKLLVIADAPRFPEEVEKSERTREIIESVDWDCEVMKNYAEVNLGIKARISSGLDWAFSQVEEAIILEDDCLPTRSFFWFCQSLLELYRYDERIMSISGSSFQHLFPECPLDPYSYFFSKYIHVWGWATWSRAWKRYDVNMKTFPKFLESKSIRLVCDSSWERKYWLNCFRQTFEGKIDTWDYQWLYHCWINSGLSIYPNANLISNLGFGVDSTNTINASDPCANVSTDDILEIQHPPFVIRDRDKDKYTFDYVYEGKKMKAENTFSGKIKRKFNTAKASMKQLIKKLILLK